MAFTGGRFKELLKKYGKVAMGVHFSVSAASITGLYVAIRNNVDVESLLHKLHMSGPTDESPAPPQIPSQSESPAPPQIPSQSESPSSSSDLAFVLDESAKNSGDQAVVMEEKKRNRTAELAASSGGALALAVLCNKALFPIRVPITIALTPPIARFLARRKIIKNSV